MKLSPPIHRDRFITAVPETRSHAVPAESRRMSVSIGKPVPRLRLTAVVRGDYQHLDSSAIADRWLVLCFPASLGAVDLLCLNRQASCFARAGAVLLGVVSDELLLQPLPYRVLQTVTVPLLTDPLNRLHRSYGIPRQPSSGKANTFLIDPDRILRHHIIHELTTWNMEALHGLLALRMKQSDPADAILAERSQECHT